MEPEVLRSVRIASLKLGGGLLLVAALIGIRIVTVTPDGVEGEVAELAAAEVEWTAAAEAQPDTTGEGSGPIFDRAISSSRSSSSRAGGGSGDAADADRLVSCDLGGGAQFMRAADCGARGGRATNVKARE